MALIERPAGLLDDFYRPFGSFFSPSLTRLAEAEAAGVKSVPAFVIDGQPYHINFGASVDDLK